MGDKQILLSVVVPVSKMAGKLNRLSNWLDELDFQECEVFLVHDIQDIRTGPELEDLIMRRAKSNLKLLSGSWNNPGGPRNFGLSQIQGKWATFWDSDDLPQVVNVLRALKSGSEYDVLVGSFQLVDSTTGNVLRTEVVKELEDIFFNPGIWRMIFKSNLLMDLKFPELRMGEDQLFLLDLKIYDKKIKFSNEIFYQYFRNHPGQLTAQKSAISDLQTTIKITFDIFRKSNSPENLYVGIMLVRQCITLLRRNPALGSLTSMPVFLYLLFLKQSLVIRILKMFLVKIAGSR